MVERKEYLDELIGWKDEQVIKAVTGIHRCGKSTLLAQYQTWLKENGIADAQIVSINFEELEYEELLDYKKLYAYLKERLIPEKTPTSFLMKFKRLDESMRYCGDACCIGHTHNHLLCFWQGTILICLRL